MISLFESGHFRLTDIIRTGKKNTAGNLVLRGLDGNGGDPRIICAVRSGIVVPLNAEQGTRRVERYGNYIRVLVDGDESLEIIYYNLTLRGVSPMEKVEEGDRIAFCANSMVSIECRRNGRLIDAPGELGISPTVGKEWGICDQKRAVTAL